MEAQREWLEKDYYKTLGVGEKATPAQVTKAYRKLAKKLHPDVNPGDDDSETRFKQVTAAYDVLGDTDKRKAYDEVRRLGPVPGAGFGAGSAGGFGPGGGFASGGVGFGAGHSVRTGQNGPEVDLEDLLGGIFSGGGGQRSGRPDARSGSDIRTEIHLDFADAITGTTTSVSVTGDVPCQACRTTGAEPGTSRQICGDCSGRGVYNENQGMFSFSRPCSTCTGRGSIVDNPCSGCAGRGLKRRRRQVKTRIPAGVTDGQILKLKGRGSQTLNGGAPGDLYVRVHVGAHPLFEHDGKNLTLTVPVTFAEAVLGADVQVPKLDGSSVVIRIPPGTSTGKRMRIRGNAAEREADIIAVVEVVVPDNLSEDQRAAVEALAAATHDNPRAHLEV